MTMYKLFDYQQKLVNEARQKLAHNDKGVMLISPAGSGKSVVIAEIARLTTEKGNRVLFMVHRKELIAQMTESFKQQDVDMSLCTLMTVRRVANRLKTLPKPSLIITDETHHSRAKSYRKVYDYYSDVPRLGFTASPWRMNHKGFTDIYDDYVEGPTVQWLIKHNHLAPFHYYSPVLTDFKSDKLKTNSTGDFTENSIDEALGKTIFGDVYQKWQKYAEGQKTIIYCHSIEYSKSVADYFTKQGIKAVHVDSKTPSAERDQIMQDFKDGKILVLCNVDLISEGFNVPDCSCSLLMRPTKSLVIFIQQSMRCMRYVPGKIATILDMVGNAIRLGTIPNDDIDWDDYFHGSYKKKQDPKTIPATCPHCFGIFNRKDAEVRCAKVHQDKDKLKVDRLLTNQPQWALDKLKETGELGKIIICPLCHQVAELTQIKPREDRKEQQDAEYIDIGSEQNHSKWLAQLSTSHTRSITRIYDIFTARKELGIPNSSGKQVNNPLFSTFSVLMHKSSKHTISEKKLHQLADHLEKDYAYVHSQYAWASNHWHFEDHDQLDLTTQLSKDFY